MRARCPNCKTLYRLSIDQIDLAEGLVRCGQCLCVFRARTESKGADQDWLGGSPLPDPQALERDEDAPQIAIDRSGSGAQTEQPLPEVRAERDDPAAAAPPVAPADAGNQIGGLASRGQRGSEYADALVDDDAPELMLHGLSANAEPARRSTGLRVLLGLTLIIVITVLAGQVAWYERDRLARIDWLRPALLAACERLNCSIRERRDLDGIQLLDRSVSSHPSVERALIISATMVNNADFRQPYPILMVSMSDIRGQVVARRHFQPSDYLENVRVEDGMIPGAPVAVVLEVTDPGGDALTFELEFF